MSFKDSNNRKRLTSELLNLSPSQLEWVQGVLDQFQLKHQYWRNPASDIITDLVLERLGDALRIHHAFSRQALSKDRFEFALERALKLSGIQADLVDSRTNRGHDIAINGQKVSLKTEAANGIKRDIIHISKWMELGKGPWELPLLLQNFLDHMKGYDRIFTMRRLNSGPDEYEYEFVEIPKTLMLEATDCDLVIQTKSSQNPKPGYGYVRSGSGEPKYSLYFDGGSERKLQIKALLKTHCIVHGNWQFQSTAL